MKFFSQLILFTLWASVAANAEIIVSSSGRETAAERTTPVQTITSEVLYQTGQGRDVAAELAMVTNIKPDPEAAAKYAREKAKKPTPPKYPTHDEIQETLIDLSAGKRDVVPYPVTIQISALTYGRGAEFRRWVPRQPVILLPQTNIRITPQKTEKIYIPKSSIAAPVAPILFGSIGAMYEGPGAKAADSPGSVCPITGQKINEGGQKRGGISESIDRAGMAAGMGLLTSKAGGELEGQKSTFILPQVPADGKMIFRFEAYNTDKKTTETFNIPVSLSSKF